MSDPVSLFVSIAGQLKVATDIAIGIGKLNTLTEVNAKAIELQGAILRLQSDAFAAQAQQSSMVNRIRDLEEELARMEQWEETKQEYHMDEPMPGTFVYALTDESSTGEPEHWICANCYENRKRSILQFKSQDFGATYHSCPHCKSVFRTGKGKQDVGFA